MVLGVVIHAGLYKITKRTMQMQQQYGHRLGALENPPGSLQV
jgi:hypothetical protein